MGNLINKKNEYFDFKPPVPVNRVPIISPRHVPSDIQWKHTQYSMFDPKNYEDRPIKEPDRYW